VTLILYRKAAIFSTLATIILDFYANMIVIMYTFAVEKTFIMAKRAYIEKNKAWLEDKAREEGVLQLPHGVYYRIIHSGEGTTHPSPRSIITAHYRGATIDGHTFDSSYGGTPLAIRLCDLIDGWIVALQQMVVGDKWELYIPAEMGYGKFSQPGIPGGSTLIFEIELLGIG
jgi:FKBP-type peptidyl-prolyl cis-trans isomerase